MKKILFLTSILTYSLVQSQAVAHIDPPFWWTAMPTNELQIMLHGKELGKLKPELNYPGVQLQSISEISNANYLILNLTISKEAEAGSFDITLTEKKRTVQTVTYELRERNTSNNRNKGFDASDVIYLLMPDRFANGNLENDTVQGMLEAADRSDPNGRHGGDIRGVLEHLDYIKELGMTAVWLTPTFENDMKPEYGAYHGYAATDLYKIDRRFGTNQEFKAFVDRSHEMGIKVIMDMIHNHVGDQHWWMKDPPTEDWFHDFEKYGTTNFRGEVQSDPYASKYDSDKLIKGWFVPELADLDQRNSTLAKYLVQNSIWWIEYSGVDGIRMDTYVYPYKEYLASWAEQVLSSYPEFSIVGESWVEKVAHEAYWQQDLKGQDDGYDSKLPSVTDFQIMFALDKALTEDFGWKNGLSRLYYAISQDRLYSDPMKNVIFLDNHDIERFYTKMGEDTELFKMGYAYLMTTRGIPQVYYGTELMFANAPVEGDGRKRADMIGGWPDDEKSLFRADGRSQQEQEAFEYVKRLTNWRKQSVAIHTGRLTHFIPQNNTYVYFRHNSEEAVMVILNRNEETHELALNRFKEILGAYAFGTDVVSGKKYELKDPLQLPAKAALILELSN